MVTLGQPLFEHVLVARSAFIGVQFSEQELLQGDFWIHQAKACLANGHDGLQQVHDIRTRPQRNGPDAVSCRKFAAEALLALPENVPKECVQQFFVPPRSWFGLLRSGRRCCETRRLAPGVDLEELAGRRPQSM